MWVCDDQPFAVISSYTQDWFVFSILDLLHLTHGWSYGCDTYLDCLECYDSDELSGWCRALCLRTPRFSPAVFSRSGFLL